MPFYSNTQDNYKLNAEQHKWSTIILYTITSGW